MRVFKHEQDRLKAGESVELIEQCRKCPAALLPGAERQRRIASAERNRQQRSKKGRYAFAPRWAHSDDRFQLVEPLLGRIVCLEPCGSLQLDNERTKRAVGVVRRTLVAQAHMWLTGDALGESRRKAGL